MGIYNGVQGFEVEIALRIAAIEAGLRMVRIAMQAVAKHQVTETDARNAIEDMRMLPICALGAILLKIGGFQNGRGILRGG